MGNAQSKEENIVAPHYTTNEWLLALESLENIIFNINDNNLIESVESTINFFNANIFPFPILTYSRMIYSSCIAQKKDFDVYLNFMIDTENKLNTNDSIIINTFSHYLLNLSSQESYFLLGRMIDLNLISSNLIKNKKTFYFANYLETETINILKSSTQTPFYYYFNENYEELSKNNWELHKQLIKEGVNPNKIAKIIRNDEIGKLQEMSTQNDFDYNQTIKPSLYERYSFINEENVSLIDYAAFFSSIKCFKYLLMNGANVENTGKYAIAGGNEEIIHLCEQNHSSFENAYETAIMFHRNDIFKYIYENTFNSNISDCLFLFTKVYA